MRRRTIIKILLGTRGSKLALAQAAYVQQAIQSAFPTYEIVIQEILTQGDKKQGTTLAGRGDKKDWILEIEEAVASGAVDLAIHSAKDVPVDIHSDTQLLPFGERERPLDAFVGRRDLGSVSSLEELKCYAKQRSGEIRIGTSSLRRRAQLLRLFPGAQVVEHRGNVPTRLDKLERDENLFGILLAEAGLRRLGLEQAITYQFSPEEFMPAFNQGILAVQFRCDRQDMNELLHAFIHPETKTAWEAERECIRVLQADCNSAVCVYGEVSQGEITVSGRVLSSDGSQLVNEQVCGETTDAVQLGKELGEKLLRAGAESLLKPGMNLRP